MHNLLLLNVIFEKVTNPFVAIDDQKTAKSERLKRPKNAGNTA